jgi:hypothetical protein
MGILRPLVLSVLCFLLTLSPLAHGQAKGLSEQELKAAALYQVVHFTRWPAGTFARADDPIVIGIYGEDPFGPLLDELVKGEAASGHPLKVVRCFTIEAAAACHLVYVPDSEGRGASRLLHELGGRSVLTVGDSDDFCERGGIIALTVRSNRIRILVNLEVARRANVTLSSKLLRLAEIVSR